MLSLHRESELSQGFAPEIFEEGGEVDLQRPGDLYQNVEAWSLLSAFKISHVIERHTCLGG